MSQKAPRFNLEASLRYSLESAVCNDKQLTTWARSADDDDLAATQHCLRELARALEPQS